MADVKWTEAQQKAIETVGKDILVSAGAGAGKTAVLTARCIYLATELQPMSDLNRVLVVTFTEAAAAEMRERIGDSLRKKLDQALDSGTASGTSRQDRALRRQLTLLDQAPIKTLHSFCASLLREFFYELNIDPLFKVLDEEEASLLRHDVLEDVFEQFYGSPDERGAQFRSLVEHYGGSKIDGSLQQSLISLHNFLTGLANPEDWLEKVRKTYQRIMDDSASDQAADVDPGSGYRPIVWEESLMKLLKRNLQYFIALFDGFMTSGELASYVKYTDDANGILAILNLLLLDLEKGDLNAVANKAKDYSMPRMPTVRDVDPGLKERFKEARKEVRDFFKTDLLKNSPEQWRDGLVTTAPHVLMLCDTYQTFAQSYSSAKRKLNAIDFSDMEHLALRLLRKPHMCQALQERFDHVLVDEYQDINEVQDEILRLVSKSPESRNLFMVGDIKQSIYGFRQADPSLFLEKHLSFSDPGTDECLLIPLKENFRSRESIIDSVNELFRFLMIPEVAKMRYDETHELVFKAHYPECSDLNFCDHHVEVHLLEKKLGPSQSDSTDSETIEDWDATEREAYFTGKRIQELLKESISIWDDDQKSYRPLSYRDIVILLRTTKERARIYADVLKQFGIPVYAEAKSGYFAATEIQDMRSLLTVLDNPRQDIPLAGLMRSPLFDFDETELLSIRHENRDCDFYGAVRQYSEKEGQLGEKCRSFLEQIDQWRTFARRNPLSTLIWHLLQTTAYSAFVSGLPNGGQRKANLLRLHNRSIQFDGFQKQGLSRFIKFIDQLDRLGTDYGEAPYLSEAEDVVRIISVHKSKGLEFPVIIVPDMCKRFNFNDEKGDILFDKHEDLLLGMKAVHLDRKWKHNTLATKMIAEGKRQNVLAEELRLLYVAMTRSREKLILVGTTEIGKTLPRIQEGASEGFDTYSLSKSRCYFDWLAPALGTLLPQAYVENCLREDGSYNKSCVQDGCLFDLYLYDGEDVSQWEQVSHTAVEPMIPREKLQSLEPVGEGEIISPEVREMLERIHWKYPHERNRMVPAKLTVSELKRRYAESDENSETSQMLVNTSPYYPRPRFLNRVETLSPAEIGTLTHLVLQHLDLSRPCDEPDIEKQISEMVDKYLLTEQQAGAVNRRSIATFFLSPLGERLLARPSKVRRETPFSLSIPATLVGKQFQGIDEPVLVQGIIDCLLETDTGYVLVDFKTDRVQREAVQVRTENYREQMILYRLAVEQAFRKPVEQAYLYFLYPGETVALDR